MEVHDVIATRPATDSARRQQIVRLAPSLRHNLYIDRVSKRTQCFDLFLDEDPTKAAPFGHRFVTASTRNRSSTIAGESTAARYALNMLNLRIACEPAR